MKTPENLKAALQEKIFRAISQETEGLLNYEQRIWEQVDALIDDIVNTVFGDEEDDEKIEELCADMDQFAKE